MQNIDFVYSIDVVKSPSGFGLAVAHDPMSNFTFLEAPPSNSSAVVGCSFLGGTGGTVETIQNGGMQMYDILMELNGENLYGRTIQSVSQAMIMIPSGARTTLKLRRSGAFIQQQLAFQQQRQFQQQLQQQQQQQTTYSPYVASSYTVSQPIYSNGVRTRHTYRPYAGYSTTGYYGAYAMLEYDADMLRALGRRWIIFGAIPCIFAIILMISIEQIWYFFLFMLLIGLVNVGRGVFFLQKANELDELDRTQPIVAQPVTPVIVQVQYGQQPYGQQGQPAQGYAYPINNY